MRILFINQYFYPDATRSAELLRELCEDLARDHDVTVVAGRPSYDPTVDQDVRGFVSRERYHGISLMRTWSTSFHRRSMSGRLLNYTSFLASSGIGALTAGSPDVVLTMTDPPLVPLVGMTIATMRRVPFVPIIQDMHPDVDVTLGLIREGWATDVWRKLNIYMWRRAEAIVAIGRDMKQRLEGYGVSPGKTRVVANWPDPRIQPLTRPSVLKRRLGLERRFVVMHSGNVGLSQSLETLVGAAEVLRDESQIHFLIVGNGAAKPQLLKRVGIRNLRNVTFLDYQPPEALSDSLGAGDLHVVALRRGLAGAIVPSKVYGVMAAGRPFIAAIEETSEVARLAREVRCGVVLPPDDPEALARGIISLRQNPDSLRVMGGRGREEIEHRYQRHQATAAYLNLLEQIVAGRQDGRRKLGSV